MVRRKQKPANMERTQKTQRQETPDTSMYPPVRGPSAGPAKGEITKIAIAVPRVSLSHLQQSEEMSKENQVATPQEKGTYMSAKIAPEFVRGHAAKQPQRNRKTRSATPFGATAHATWKIV